ncbi:GNAT family N-acetyltransferase [Pseudomonas sp. LS1212]|uniref:GNAT family N-acetyltransferase n=1 Tax=Pseudomonas sp. LS1212 TaxID=2972478 RepID=UPI00215D426A|nr:GNAT family N-acetyltransferase [Pseudomonas sp. LS1212]UVJ43366.1 GNAT family N-acetyltransferase [Pseudomonas sp. LS1212]
MLNHPITVSESIQLEVADAKFSEQIYETVRRNKEHLSTFLDWPKQVTRPTDSRHFMTSAAASHAAATSKTFVILFNDTPIGIIGFNSIDKQGKTASIGYWLDEQFQGRGIISKSLKCLLENASRNNFLNHFTLKCATHNKKSNSVALRNGFTFEGILKEAEIINGVYHDQNIYSKTIKA